jgi:hypothetical protein
VIYSIFLEDWPCCPDNAGRYRTPTPVAAALLQVGNLINGQRTKRRKEGKEDKKNISTHVVPKRRRKRREVRNWSSCSLRNGCNFLIEFVGLGHFGVGRVTVGNKKSNIAAAEWLADCDAGFGSGGKKSTGKCKVAKLVTVAFFYLIVEPCQLVNAISI